MSKLSLLLGALVDHPLRHLVRMRRALEEHTVLVDENRFALSQDLMTDTKIVADRWQMLELLPKAGVVGEIGVAQGNFSQNIIQECTPQALHLIDPWDNANDERYSEGNFQKLKEKFATEIEMGQVVLHRGYSNDVLPGLPENLFDWVYVDGAHDYASVRNDLKMCERVVKPGGIIAGHDYVRWVSPTERYGVMEAVNEFALSTRSPLVLLTNQHDKHDSFALKLNKNSRSQETVA